MLLPAAISNLDRPILLVGEVVDVLPEGATLCKKCATHLRDKPAAAPASAPNPEPFSVEVDESEWFGDPKKAAAKVAAAAAKQAAAEATKAAREEAALASRTAQIEAQFYGRFKDLSPEKHGRLVNAFAEDFAREVGQMDPYRRAAIYPDPMKSVHDKVREYLDGLAEEARTKPKSTPPLHVAPGGGAAPAVAPATSAKPQTEKERFDSYMASLRAMTNR
jgi:hypothetical protein